MSTDETDTTAPADPADGPTATAQAWTPPPWEPPLSGTEAEHLFGALDRMRATFRYKVDGLDAAGLAARIPSSRLSLGGLLKHLAAQEDHNSTVKLTGAKLDAVWDDNGWDERDDWEFESAADDDPAYLYELWDGAVERARTRYAEALARGGLGGDIHASSGGTHASLRRLVCDMVEEYGRHTGHADILREAVDGRTGEDPDPHWRPQSGRDVVSG